MTSKHTPGPWDANLGHDGRQWGFVRPEGEETPGPVAIAQVFKRGSHDEREANARLIAASPTMLAVLRRAEDFVVGLDGAQEIWEAIRAARREAGDEV